MVVNATSLSRSGLSDFLLQRLTAVVIGLYCLCIVGFLLLNPNPSYAMWMAYQSSGVMLVFSTLTILAICIHAWIGMWTVGTDYLSENQLGKRATFWRLTYQYIVVLAIFGYGLWGIAMLWLYGTAS